MPVHTCADRSPESSDAAFFMFLPIFAAEVSEEHPTASFKGGCFEKITFQYEANDDTSFFIHVNTSNPKSPLCHDVILFANTEIQHFEVFFFHGTHKIKFVMNTPEKQADVGYGGIKAFAFCDNIVEDFQSIMTTLTAFIGGLSLHSNIPIIGSHVPGYMERANLKFIRENLGVELEERPIQKVEIDPDTIQSGDFFGIMRLDGLDQIIMYGTGSRIGHNTMALRFDGELYVVES